MAYLIRLDDVDAAGVVFAPRICAIAHALWEEELALAGLPLARLLAEGRHALPLVRLEADFLAPLRHGERILAGHVATPEGDCGFRVAISLVGEDGRLRARVVQEHACIALPERRRTALPGEVAAALSRLPAAPR
jgi:acyl-CoA thioesterase FadM